MLVPRWMSGIGGILPIVLLLCSVLVLLPDEPACGQGPSPLSWTPGQGIRVPQNKKLATRSQMYVEVTPLDEGSRYGYSRVRFEFHSPRPVTSDTLLSVRATAEGFYYSQLELTVEQHVEMASGESVATLDLLLPAYCPYHRMHWETRVDGRRDSDLSLTKDSYFSPSTNPSSNIDEAVLVLDASSSKSLASVVDPLRTLAQSLPALAQANQMGQYGHPGEPVHILRRELPDQVLDYTMFDIVRIDAETLQEQMQQRPEAVEALIDWVAAGGSLWVTEVGREWQKLHEVSELLGLASSELNTTPDPDLPAGLQSWDYLNLASMATTLGSSQQANALARREQLMEELEGIRDALPEATQTPPVYSEEWFAVQRLGWGMVAAMPHYWETPPSGLKDSAHEHALKFWEQRGWISRHGLRPTDGNERFSDFLIPGVGLAPVVEFQVLITLFAIAIGPVNYWLLKRARKVHLMVLTVPAIALTVTGGLMLYGLVADGLGTRVRAMSITHLDETAQRASSWSRLSYYAAFAPSEGLEFGKDTAIYPIFPGRDDGAANDYRYSDLEMEWTDTTQRLTNGWLRSRTPTQYLVVEPKSTTAGLGLRKTTRLRGTNRLGATLQLVLAVDAQGQWYRARGVGQDAPFELEEVEASAAAVSYREAVRDREPKVPDAALAGSSWSPSSRRLYGYHRSAGDFDRSLHTQLWKDLLGLDGRPPLPLPPGSYLAVSHEAAVASLGIDHGVEESSVHIVLGSW